MDCIDNILDFYNNKDTEELQIRLGKILIKLMDDLKNPKNLDCVRSCLILLINLFFDIESPDHYHLQGKSSSELTKDELDKVNDLLIKELNNFNLN